MKVLSITFGLVIFGALKASAIDAVYVTNPVKISTQSTVSVSPASGSTQTVQGVDSHDAAVTGRPVLIGGYASLPEYWAIGPRGAATSDAVWLIYKFFYDSEGDFTHSLCSKDDVVYDNRATSVTYS